MDAKEEAIYRAKAFIRRSLTDCFQADAEPLPGLTLHDYLAIKHEFAEATADRKREFCQAVVDEAWSWRIEDMVAEVRRGGRASQAAHAWLLQGVVLFTAYAMPLPPLLQEYAVTNGLLGKRPPGRPTELRNSGKVGIAMAVAILTRCGLPRARNRYTQPTSPTACSAVAEILKEIGIIRTEAAVEKAFEQHRQLAEKMAAVYPTGFVRKQLL
jgi:hypothetical protein